MSYRLGPCRPDEVQREVAGIYAALFPGGDAAFVPRVFGWVQACFEGREPDYQAIDLRYHDFEHTLQGTLCLARLLHGRARARAEPAVRRSGFELGLLAMLFHDTGYLKRRDDLTGTGAKYTAVHVGRSAEFARVFLGVRGYRPAQTRAIGHMIRCTGVAVDLAAIPFQNEQERLLGCALGTADLLGQMAAPDYLEKLDALYQEFAEAARAGGPLAGRFAAYRSAEDLRRKTPAFWETYVLPRLRDDFQGLYRFLNRPWPDGPNAYLDQIERHLARLRQAAGA